MGVQTHGANKNSSSPSTLLFSTKLTCLHRCLQRSYGCAPIGNSQRSGIRDKSWLHNSLLERCFTARIELNNPVNGRIAFIESL